MTGRPTVLLWNCNGYRAHSAQLTLYLDSLRRSSSPPPSIIMLTETKIPNDYSPSLPGYICFSRPFLPNSSGCAIFVRKSISVRPWLRDYSSSHVLGVECRLPGIPHPLRVVVAYRQEAEGKVGWEKLADDLKAAAADDAPVLIGGDFNAHHPCWAGDQTASPSPYGRSLFTLCEALSLDILNHALSPGIATHVRGNVLDLFLTNCSHLFPSLSIERDSDLISDHFPLLLSLPSVHTPHPGLLRPRWHTKRANAIEFAAACNEVAPPFVQAAKRLISSGRPSQHIADEVYECIRQPLLLAATLSVPSSYRLPKRKPWWHGSKDKLEATHREYKRARRAVFRARSEEGRLQAQLRLRAARKAWEEAVAEAQALYKRQRRDALVTDDGSVNWREWQRQTRTANTLPFSVQGSDGRLPASPTDALNNIASYLAGVFKPVAADNLPQRIREHHTKVAACVDELRSRPLSPVPTDERERDFSFEEVRDFLLAVNTKKAYGPDDIHPYFIAKAPKIIMELILLAFNFFWASGVLPSFWKMSNVTVIYKGEGLKESASSYRPISLTCVLCKVFERLVLTRLAVTFHPSQAGFRPGRSCDDQIFLMAEAARTALQEEANQRARPRRSRERRHRAVAFIDFSKAFDRVDHASFLYKLHLRGVGPRVWRFFDAFLRGRRFRVVACGFFSDWFIAEAGVPQGSVLGPFVFLVLIDDLPRCIESVGGACQLFADDVTLWGRSLGYAGDKQLQRSLSTLLDWALLWKLLINLDKSCYIVFSYRRYLPSFEIGGEPLKAVRHARYLGVWFSADLSWAYHAQRVLTKARASSNLICRVASDVRSARVTRVLTLAIVRAQISYAFPFWQPAISDMERLQRCILRPLKRCLGLPDSAHSESVLVELGICSLRRYWQQKLMAWAARCTALIQRCKQPEFPVAAAYERLARHRHQIIKMRQADPSCSLPAEAFSLPMVALSIYFEEWRPLRRSHKDKCRNALGPAADVDGKLPLSISSFTAKELKRIALLLSYRDWRSSGEGSLQRYRFDDRPGLAPYLVSDDRQTFCLRARLRFARSYLRAHQHRLGLADSAVCEQCDLGRDETAEHVVLECPKYNAARRELQATLLQHQLALSPAVVLAALWKKNKLTPAVLEATGKFLRTISDLRGL